METNLFDLQNIDSNTLMRRAFSIAVSSREKGNHPFGALLCDLDGNILLEAENTVHTENDVTCHAEQNLMSAASRKFSDAERSLLVMVTSAEPCAMCSGATFWNGVRAVIYGLPEFELTQMCTSSTVLHPAVLNVPCRQVFGSSPRHPTQVVGPLLLEEARVPHAGFWGAGY